MSRELASTYLSNIKQVVREAEQTDYVMPIWLPYLGGILAVIGGIVLLAVLFASSSMHQERYGYYAAGPYGGEQGLEFAASLGIGILVLAVVVGVIIDLYVIYKWIARRNNHFSRIQRLYTSIINFLESLGVKDPELVNMKNIAEEARFKESEKSAGLWLILYIVLGFIAWAYIMHFLTRDFVEHEHREQMFFKNLAEIAKRRNIALEPPQRRVPDRNTILYLILTIVTLGLFALYWIYTVTKDPNEHFLEHRLYEQRLVDAFEAMI